MNTDTMSGELPSHETRRHHFGVYTKQCIVNTSRFY